MSESITSTVSRLARKLVKLGMTRRNAEFSAAMICADAYLSASEGLLQTGAAAGSLDLVLAAKNLAGRVEAPTNV